MAQASTIWNCRKLRPYLTSYTNIVEGETPKSSVWHLVDSVRIHGAFDVLGSCAVSLVDVPGFGDANKTRTKRTEEYLKTAEVVVLGSLFESGPCLLANHVYQLQTLSGQLMIR
ncbi:hypothetical protein BDR05DRAFT_75319 [Suillus weaverae]|nr:hypothetical protein BDR05DRAFT_75319 [Suillus weaverae]